MVIGPCRYQDGDSEVEFLLGSDSKNIINVKPPGETIKLLSNLMKETLYGPYKYFVSMLARISKIKYDSFSIFPFFAKNCF